MKILLVAFFSGLLFCGCSQKPGAAGRAIDQVKAGDTIWHGDAKVYTLHVDQREGDALRGVTVTATLADGKTQTISAETATLAAGSDAANGRSVTVLFHDAKIQTGPSAYALPGSYPVELHE